MKNKVVMSVLAVVLIVSLAIVGCAPKAAPAEEPPAAVEKYTLTASSGYPAPTSNPDSLAEQRWMDLVTERTNGRLTFDVSWGGALGDVMESLEITRSRVVDLGLSVQEGAHPAEFPLCSFLYALPFGPDDPEVVLNAMWRVYDEYYDVHRKFEEAQNIKFLYYAPWDNYNIMSRDPIKTLKDLEGKVFGSWGIYFPRWFESVGGAGDAKPAPDRYMLLKTGVLDASVCPPQVDVTYKLYEVCDCYTIANFGAIADELAAINLDAFNELPPDIQKILVDTAREVSLWHAGWLKETRQEAFDKLKAEGVEFYELSEEDRTIWANQMSDLSLEWIKKVEAMGLPGREILKTYVDACEEGGHIWLREWGP